MQLWREKILPVRNGYGFYHNMAFIKYNTIQPVSLMECFILVINLRYFSDASSTFPNRKWLNTQTGVISD